MPILKITLPIGVTLDQIKVDFDEQIPLPDNAVSTAIQTPELTPVVQA